MTDLSTSANIAYADCFSGVSGDMLLGALVHAGLDRDRLTLELAKLSLDGLEFIIEEKVVQNGRIVWLKIMVLRHFIMAIML